MALQIQEVQPQNPQVARFVKAAKTDEVNPGNSINAKLEGHFIGIHNVDGEYYAVDNICPHVGGLLHAGQLEDGVVICPIHQWKFDVKTGKCIWPGKCELATYPVKVDAEHIFVDINSPSHPIQHNPIRVYHTKPKRRSKP
jgi:nitrite reductase/ring-hydroxylating ferredoxin subunit